MAKRFTQAQIEQVQELGRQRWNAMIRREEDQYRREMEQADRAEDAAQARRARIRIVK